MTVVLANGTVTQLSPETHPKLWPAFALSVGRLGVIVDVTLRIQPNELVFRDVEAVSVTQLLREVRGFQERFVAAAGKVTPELEEDLDGRQYLWFMTRGPRAPNAVWRATHRAVERTSPNDDGDEEEDDDKEDNDNNATTTAVHAAGARDGNAAAAPAHPRAAGHAPP